MTRQLLQAVVFLAAIANPATAAAADITVWTTRAIATVLAEIGGEFERATGHRLIITTDLPPAFLRRARANEPFDVLITGSGPIDEWIRDGRIVAKTRTAIARSGIGVEVRAGRPKPDITTVDGFKRALLSAKSIAFLNVGSGIHVESVIAQLGISDAIASKTIRPDTDIVSELVAKGEVEIGMVVITQILTTRGVDLVGPLPSELQSYVTFVAGISAQSKSPAQANQLIQFLLAPRAAAIIKSQGMEPAR
jgi:molybdate transport system substrate-binding protein